MTDEIQNTDNIKTEEVKQEDNMLPHGSVYRILKPVIKSKDCGFTKEFTPALNKAMCKLMIQITEHACDLAKDKNRKGITLDILKVAGEKYGILIEG